MASQPPEAAFPPRLWHFRQLMKQFFDSSHIQRVKNLKNFKSLNNVEDLKHHFELASDNVARF